MKLAFCGFVVGLALATLGVEGYSGVLSTEYRMVWRGVKLAEVVSAKARAYGSVSMPGNQLECCRWTNDGAKASAQFQSLDDGYTKCVVVELRQAGSDVEARIVRACHSNRGVNVLGQDMSKGYNVDKIATPLSRGGYGIVGLMAVGAGKPGPSAMAFRTAHASSWICAADAKIADRPTQLLQQAAEGTSWFVSSVTNRAALKRATWAVSGLGVFEVYANGNRVGGEQALKPGYTHPFKTKYYFTYDVTSQLKLDAGASNVFTAEVSAGWWRDQIVVYAGRRSAFRGELRLEYADGSCEVRGTNARDWRARVGGPVVRAGIFDGEVYDARIPAPVLGDAAFRPAVECDDEFLGETFPNEGAEVVRRWDLALKPVAAYCWKGVEGAGANVHGKVVKTREFKADQELEVSPGETLVVDFGQNTSAVPHFRMRGAKGVKLSFRMGEMLNEANGERKRGNDGPAGSLYRENLRLHKNCILLDYTFGGDGEGAVATQVEYFPRFTFFAYRYASITATGPVKLWIESVPVTSITKEMEIGEIETGDAAVNRLIANAWWGQLSNYLSVPTDCPQRNERQGWAGDTQIFSESGTFNADTRRFFHKWMRDMRDTQLPLGGFPLVAPIGQCAIGESMSLGLSDAGVIVPYNVWKQFGDTEIVDQNWEAMERHVDRCAATQYQMKNVGVEVHNFQVADWLSYEHVAGRDRVNYWNYLGACYWLWDARMMRAMAAGTGRDADKYARMAEAAKAFIKAEFFNADGTFKLAQLNSMQTPAVFALWLDLVEGEPAKAMVARLRENFKRHGDCLQTGFLGTSILMDALSRHGMDDVAYTLLLQHKHPSWLYSVDQGATTIWERWNGYTKAWGFGHAGMNSFNHYSYGAVLAWIYKTAAGIASDPEAPGFKTIVMRPVPDRRLKYVKAKYRTPQGEVKSAWHYEGEKWVWEFTVPAGSVAKVTLPGETSAKIYPAGNHRIERKMN